MIQSSAAVAADGTIYFECHDQNFYALNPDGALKWSFHVGAPVFSSPAIDSNGTIYFGVMDGFVYALDPDGTLDWRYKTGGPVMSSPVIAPDGVMYIGSDDGVMYAFETGSQGLQADAYWPCFKHDAARTGRSDVSASDNPDAVEENTLPVDFLISSVYPNPFNPSATISFTLPEDSHVRLSLYSVTGQKVVELVDERLNAGDHVVKFDAGELSSGVYLYRIEAGTASAAGKMVLVR